MNEQQWNAMTEDQQTQHCVRMTKLWLAEAAQQLSGGGATRVVGGEHIYQREAAP